MQWILQEFEDTTKLALALDRLGIAYSWHKVVPFIGELLPEPDVIDPNAVVLFGSYSLWRTAEAKGWRPGVFKIEPFLSQEAWKPFLLNGNVRQVSVQDVAAMEADELLHFVRPVNDSKEFAGTVMTTADLVAIARSVMSVSQDEIPNGSLSHDTLLFLAPPVSILKEWRCWVVDGEVVTWSLYKQGSSVIYHPDIDADALAFARRMVEINPGYSPAYVLDICLTDDGLRLLETNGINAAGFYAADLIRLASAIDALQVSA